MSSISISMSLVRAITKLSLLCIVVLMLAACAVNPATGSRDFVLMSESEELALGRQYSQQVMKEYRAYDNLSLQKYVQFVGDKVARTSHRNNLIYRFTLLDSTQVNAFALPGGYIYITRGLLAYLNSEAELAAVLGHELGHVTARHSVRQHSMSTTSNVLGSIVAAAAGVQGVGQLTNLLSTGIIRGYGREHELEADGLGVEYLARAGYPTAAMKKVITTLKNQELFDKKLAKEQGRDPRTYHGVFSTHPDNDTRLQQVLNKPSQLALPQSTRNQQDAIFLKKLSGLTYGDSAEDGIIRGNNFYHPDLDFKITFPKQWRITNGAKSITVNAPNNEGVIQLTLQDLNQKIVPKEFLQTRIGVDGVISEMPLPIAGHKGYSVVVKANTPYGKRKMRVTALFVKQRAFIFFAAAKQDALFKLFDRDFLGVVKSFSRLSAKDKRLAVELKLQVVKYKKQKSLRALAQHSPITRHAEDQLRLLNAFFPIGEPKAGDLIKIVR